MALFQKAEISALQKYATYRPKLRKSQVHASEYIT
jgi:hypothetical protein